jgi:hypothetical protein
MEVNYGMKRRQRGIKGKRKSSGGERENEWGRENWGIKQNNDTS